VTDQAPVDGVLGIRSYEYVCHLDAYGAERLAYLTEKFNIQMTQQAVTPQQHTNSINANDVPRFRPLICSLHQARPTSSQA
jgi:hypothetical protein